MSQSDDQGRSESSPYGQGATGQSPYGQPAQGQQQFGAQEHYGQQSYGQSQPYGQQYGQTAAYGRPQYGQVQQGQTAYGQQYDPQQYGQQQYAAQQYGGYGHYGESGVPAKPGGVVIAAVLGFVFGALGVLISLGLMVGGAAASGVSAGEEEDIFGVGEIAGAVGGVLIAFGVVALAWTVVMIWGSVWALTGRTRVMLLVGGAIAVAFTLLGFLSSVADSANSGTGGIIWTLLFLLAALAIVVLLSMRPAAAFYAAHRARRGR